MKIKYHIIIVLFFLMGSCSKKEDISLEIMNSELFTYDKNSKKDTINCVTYKLTNNSDEIFYIKSSYFKINPKPGILKDDTSNLFMRVYDSSNDNEIKYIPSFHDSFGETFASDSIKEIREKKELKNLGYKGDLFLWRVFNSKNNDFIIYPNETIYFEYSIQLQVNKINNIIDHLSLFGEIENGKKYYSKLFIVSDSSKYKDILPRNILKTIKENNIKIYHGIIESKNKVPVKVLE